MVVSLGVMMSEERSGDFGNHVICVPYHTRRERYVCGDGESGECVMLGQETRVHKVG